MEYAIFYEGIWIVKSKSFDGTVITIGSYPKLEDAMLELFHRTGGAIGLKVITKDGFR